MNRIGAGNLLQGRRLTFRPGRTGKTVQEVSGAGATPPKTALACACGPFEEVAPEIFPCRKAGRPVRPPGMPSRPSWGVLRRGHARRCPGLGLEFDRVARRNRHWYTRVCWLADGQPRPVPTIDSEALMLKGRDRRRSPLSPWPLLLSFRALGPADNFNEGTCKTRIDIRHLCEAEFPFSLQFGQ